MSFDFSHADISSENQVYTEYLMYKLQDNKTYSNVTISNNQVVVTESGADNMSMPAHKLMALSFNFFDDIMLLDKPVIFNVPDSKLVIIPIHITMTPSDALVKWLYNFLYLIITGRIQTTGARLTMTFTSQSHVISTSYICDALTRVKNKLDEQQITDEQLDALGAVNVAFVAEVLETFYRRDMLWSEIFAQAKKIDRVWKQRHYGRDTGVSYGM